MVTHLADTSKLPSVLALLGMVTVAEMESGGDLVDTLDVLLDGRLMGWVARGRAADMVDKLRMLKISATDLRVPHMTEIVLVPVRDIPGQFPGVFIFTGIIHSSFPAQ